MTIKHALIRNWGCQMNVYDGQRMADILVKLNYQLTDDPDKADLVIFNTCHIREKATEKIYSELGRLYPNKPNMRADDKNRAKKRAKKIDKIVAIAGCVAQAEGEEILKKSPIVDMVFGPQSYHRLPEMLEKLGRKKGTKILDLEFPTEDKFDALPATNVTYMASSPKPVTAFLTIQEGCDKFCSFCVVPYTRGAEYSRPAAKIFAEADNLLQQNIQEITLLGQNVNGWQGMGTDGNQWSFARLLYGFAEKFPQLKRLRYTTSHPRHMDDELIRAHGELPLLMPYLHLPIQSGSDNMLKAMNRGHSRDDYLRIIDKLRAACPDIALSSDFIIGFPNESDKDFADTINLVNQVNYASAYSFKYSPRPGTPAALLTEQIDEKIKSERLQILQQLLNAQQKAFNISHIGKTLPILFEKHGKHDHQLIGRTPYLQPAYADLSDTKIGQEIDCVVNELTAHSFAVKPIHNAA
ncbi:MAG: tRNA (N6-isopentenyl adenosine(37)-C2)-methylthiotransferase MiaB [Alphaproteobacteria bacterium]|nr:tRNA (N6-isopentenyl adenosine(37)-C2)-methylthiotransferase MiaB [Alphaproteobacteria bacterium]